MFENFKKIDFSTFFDIDSRKSNDKWITLDFGETKWVFKIIKIWPRQIARCVEPTTVNRSFENDLDVKKKEKAMF